MNSCLAVTGGDDGSEHLLDHLRQAVHNAVAIDIIVSFLMESGVRLLADQLAEAVRRGVRIRILTGTYLGITEPSALYLLKSSLGDGAEIRLYNDSGRSFHPKSYIFHYPAGAEIFIGSSNISRSALTSAIEWNYRFSSLSDAAGADKLCRVFNDLFEHHSDPATDDFLRSYSKSWRRPPAMDSLDVYDRAATSAHGRKNRDRDGNPSPDAVSGDDGRTPDYAQDCPPRPIFLPRGAQIEALYALNRSRLEGADRGLVIAATGVGKTAIAAFDSLNFGKVLFVAHREEILTQAGRTFGIIRKTRDIGRFNAHEKISDRQVILASVFTLAPNIEGPQPAFVPDAFDYVVIDEAHHSASAQFRKVASYFRPKFMLGLTATPERMDGRSIFEIFGYCVPYEIQLAEAINKGYLVSFRYFGIYDDTDYSGLRTAGGRYQAEDLNRRYLGNLKRQDLIFAHYRRRGSRCAIGFCCSREHAEDMAGAFCQRGVPAAAVYSGAQGERALDREEAVRKLESGELRVLFTVDMFNEGVDIACIDMVLFLRPTDSPVIFLQQLGRGLRKAQDKQYLTVLDFIGNYEKAGRIRRLLSARDPGEREDGAGNDPCSLGELPAGCQADFDLRLIDLFEKMDRQQLKLRDRLMAEYRRIRQELGRRPMRCDLFTLMDDGLYHLLSSSSKRNFANPFKSYLNFLEEAGELTPDEHHLVQNRGRELLLAIESTSMTKVYKMPVLGALIREDGFRPKAGKQELLASWKEFFARDLNWRDLDRQMSYERFLKLTDDWHLKKIYSMPVHFLLKSSGQYFTLDEDGAFGIRDEFREAASLPAFARHYSDIIRFRTLEYFRSRYYRWEREGTEDPNP